MNTPRKFYYFCRPLFKRSSGSYYHEIQCLRVAENNPRLTEYQNYFYTRGLTVEIDYNYIYFRDVDKEWEEKKIWESYKWKYCPSTDKIVYISEDDIKMK